MMIRTVLLALAFTAAISTSGQNREPAFAMNERLGRGINMGNSFEAPTETEWGNPWKEEYFQIIANLGFKHVRVPVRWEPSARSMASPPYTINATFLSRIKEVVDAALKYDLHIIINMHHHDALFANPADQKARFLSQWDQIATYFKDYSDMLLFEVLNEPHGGISPAMWNTYFADALAEIRKTNPTRVVLMGVAEFGGLGALSQLELPDDEYIIVSPHYYNPFPFTHQGAEWVDGANAWLGTKWLDTEPERQAIMSEFNYALHFSQTQNVPIHVGEFGAYSKADHDSRVRWTTFLARWFEEQQLSWAYWEFSAGFGIYNPTTKQYVSSLVDALLHNELPAAIPVHPTSLYTSNFAGNDGWNLTQQGGASGSLSASGSLNISITSGGTEGWHLQLVRNNIRLEKDKLYRLSFTASAAADRSVTFYAGRASSPWNAYSGTNSFTLSATPATYYTTFTMTSPTDNAARLVFDLGKNTSAVTISNVKVEELSLTPVTSIEQNNRPGIAYPNPVKGTSLNVVGLTSYRSATFADLQGRNVSSVKIAPESTSLNVEDLPSGMYILTLEGKAGSTRLRIVKEN